MSYNHVILGVSILVLSARQLFAQTKIKDGTVIGSSSLLNTNAILELESNNKGFLLPRVALDSTLLATPLSANVAGMTVYNTATAHDVTPGYYYNDGSQWVRLPSPEPWYSTVTHTGAKKNSDSVYIMGKVGVGYTDPKYTLNVNGEIVGKRGMFSPTVNGGQSIAIGPHALDSMVGDGGYGQIAIGAYALNKINNPYNANIGIGNGALGSIENSNSNIAIGGSTMGNFKSGSANIVMGFGYNIDTGSSNILLGGLGTSGVNTYHVGSSNILLGNVRTYSRLINNHLNIGGLITADGIGNYTNILNPIVNGKVGIRLPAMADNANSTLQVNGSFSLPIISVTANCTLTDTNYKLVVRTTGTSDITVTLPDPTTCAGRMYVVQYMNGAGGGVKFSRAIEIGLDTTIAANSQCLTGSTTGTNFIGGSGITLQSDGTTWTGITQKYIYFKYLL
ncbi:MAG: hypothetical protein JST36_03785 [Bacteroidetes bacterium]|nr:hypothetical protein [Bacteroidota bacterium]